MSGITDFFRHPRQSSAGIYLVFVIPACRQQGSTSPSVIPAVGKPAPAVVGRGGDLSSVRHTCVSVAGIPLKKSQDRFPIENGGHDADGDGCPITNVGHDNPFSSSPPVVCEGPSSLGPPCMSVVGILLPFGHTRSWWLGYPSPPLPLFPQAVGRALPVCHPEVRRSLS